MCTIGAFTEESPDDINVFVDDGHYVGDEEDGDGGMDNDNNNPTVMFYSTPTTIQEPMFIRRLCRILSHIFKCRYRKMTGLMLMKKPLRDRIGSLLSQTKP